MTKTYPRDGDKQTIYLNAVVKNPQIEISDYTIGAEYLALVGGRNSAHD